MVLNDIHLHYTMTNFRLWPDGPKQCSPTLYNFEHNCHSGGGELYLILVVAATARRLTGRSGYRSIGVDTILGGQEELGRMTEEKGATS
jgi:hypothetical protein